MFQPGATIRVGRELDCDVVIDDPRASRHHLVIAVEGETWTLRDQSSNGTFLNGMRVNVLPLTEPALTFRLGDATDGATVTIATVAIATDVNVARHDQTVPTPAAAAQQPVQAATPVAAGAARPLQGTEVMEIAAAAGIAIASVLPWFSSLGVSINAWNVSIVALVKGRAAGGPATGLILAISAGLVVLPFLASRFAGARAHHGIALLGSNFAIDVAVIGIAAGIRLHSGPSVGEFVALAAGLILPAKRYLDRAKKKTQPSA